MSKLDSPWLQLDEFDFVNLNNVERITMYRRHLHQWRIVMWFTDDEGYATSRWFHSVEECKEALNSLMDRLGYHILPGMRKDHQDA